MGDPLERLVHTLRQERCPDSVLELARRRLARERGHGPRRFPRFALAMAGVSLVLVLIVVGHQATRPDRNAGRFATQTTLDHAEVAVQARGALAIIGQALLRTASHAETALLEDAAPPLLKSFQTAKTKLTENL